MHGIIPWDGILDCIKRQNEVATNTRFSMLLDSGCNTALLQVHARIFNFPPIMDYKLALRGKANPSLLRFLFGFAFWVEDECILW